MIDTHRRQAHSADVEDLAVRFEVDRSGDGVIPIRQQAERLLDDPGRSKYSQRTESDKIA